MYDMSCMHTVPIRPNLTESKPQLNSGFTFWIYSRLTRVDQELTHSKPKINSEWTSRVKKPRFAVLSSIR